MKLSPDHIPPGWAEPNLGPGVSRPKADERTRDYRLWVKRPDMPPMRVLMPAPTKAKAVSYCENRWPNATVEVIE
jgi:hypothetical protein